MSNKQDKFRSVERWSKQVIEEYNNIKYIKEMEYKQDTDRQKKKIKRTECPYGGIDCAWCTEDCE